MKLRTGARPSTIQRDSEHLEKIKGNCYFCHKEVDGMFYCFGCHHFVCEECDTGEVMGKHSVQEHRE